MNLVWQPMRQAHIEGVMAIADAVFPDFFEESTCFEERFSLSPSSCFVLVTEMQDVKGYIVSYPWTYGNIPPLNQKLGGLPDQHNVLYIHDLALHPEVMGKGKSKEIVARLMEHVEQANIGHIALVAVNASTPFWQSFGFQITDPDITMQPKLATYGDDARYMVWQNVCEAEAA